MEEPRGDLSLTPEQLEIIAAERKKHQAAWHYEYRHHRAPLHVLEKIRLNRHRHYEEVVRPRFATQKYKDKRRAYNLKAAPGSRAREERAVAEKWHHCELCDMSFKYPAILEAHLATDRHKRVAAGLVIPRCEPCDLVFRFPSQLGEHQRLKKHIAQAAKYLAQQAKAGGVDEADDDESDVPVSNAPPKKKQSIASTKAHQLAAVANKTFYCAPCKVACRDMASLRRHDKNLRHLRKMERGDDPYVCGNCSKAFRFPSDLKAHFGKVRACKAWEKRSSSA